MGNFGAFVFAWVMAYPFSTALGIPTYFVFKKNGWLNLWQVMLAGITLGIISEDKAEVIQPALSGLVVTLGQHLLEDGSAGCKCVHVGRSNDRVAGKANHVPPHIIEEEEDDIPQPATQRADRLKQKSQRRDEGHRRQHDDQEGSYQRPDVDPSLLVPDELQAGRCDNDHCFR